MNIIIRQRENGKFQAIIPYKVDYDWKQKSKGGFDTKKDAEKWAKEMSFELQKLEKSGVLGNEYTLGEVFELFFELKDFKVENTKDLYENTKNFFEKFSDEIISEIRLLDLQRYLTKKRNETGNSYNNYATALKAVYNFAIRKLKACNDNIAADLSRVETKDTREKFITEKMYEEILKNTKKEKEKLFLRTAYETGARLGELLGIKVQDVNNLKVKIYEQFTKKKVISERLKSKNSYREIPISKELFFDLKKSDCTVDGRIFYDICHNTVNYHLKPYNVSLHCFRHTRASILVSQKFDLAIIANVMGDTIDTIIKTYAHVNKDELENNFELIRNSL